MGTDEREDHDGVVEGSEAGDLEGLEGEGLLALELVEELETLETGRLLVVGRDLTGLSTGACFAGRCERSGKAREGEETRGKGTETDPG